MYCENCGSELLDGDRFCYRCGRPCRQKLVSDCKAEPRDEHGQETIPDTHETFGESSPGAPLPPPGPPSDPPVTEETVPAGVPMVRPAAAETSADPVAIREQMKKDIGGWGIGLIIMGVLSIALPQTFDPVWGVIIIILGVINLIVRERGMYIANGTALIFIGIINTIGTLMDSSSTTFFGVYGVLQFIWGVRELIKYGKYGKLARPKETESKKPGLSKTVQILIGIPLFYIGFGLVTCLYELLAKGPWYTYQDIFGETHIIFQEAGSQQLPAFVSFIETLFYPLFAIFRSL